MTERYANHPVLLFASYHSDVVDIGRTLVFISNSIVCSTRTPLSYNSKIYVYNAITITVMTAMAFFFPRRCLEKKFIFLLRLSAQERSRERYKYNHFLL